jgi:hypothetical protein
MKRSRFQKSRLFDTSLSGIRVARELDRIAVLRGHPCPCQQESHGAAVT